VHEFEEAGLRMSFDSSWIVMDYGQVISQPMAEGAIGQMARLADLEPELLSARYWKHRDAYDRGTALNTYWGRVIGRELAPGDDLATELSRLDVAAWSNLSPSGLAAIERFGAAGHRLALLSNAPADMADAIDRTDWARPFAHLFFSCRLGTAKPDAEIYRAVLDRLGSAPAEITFYDDRAENIHAAAALGINAVQWPVEGLAE
jgi:putative hydrolase of the HAD superfamily